MVPGKQYIWFLVQLLVNIPLCSSAIPADYVDTAYHEAIHGWKKTYLDKQTLHKDHDAQYDNPLSCRWKHGIVTHMTSKGYDIEQKGFMELATLDVILKRPDSPYQSIHDMYSDYEFLAQWKKKFPYCEGDGHPECNHDNYYRTADGSCNNPYHRAWGKSHIPHRRLLDPHYGDSYNLGYEVRKGIGGYALPSPRHISNLIMRVENNPDVYDQLFSVEFMDWGHFIKHDITQTPVSKGKHRHNINCCDAYRKNYITRYECLPIHVDAHHDPYYYGIKCMNFVRSSPAVHTDGKCKPRWRDQLNQVSSYLDGSMVYGTDKDRQKKLRKMQHGLMRVSEYGLLPRHPEPKCYYPEHNPYNTYCEYAGDERVDVTPGSSAHHNLMVKEHNRIAKRLHACFKDTWDDEKLFQETRKIIIAIIQKITYADYLPKLLGPKLMAKYKLRVGHSKDNYYDPYINPTTTNVFSTAAFRVGHTYINDYTSYNYNENRKRVDWYAEDFQDYDRSYSYFNPEYFVTSNKQDQITLVRAIVKDNAHAADQFLSPKVVDHLFDDDYVSVDLGAYNIQRGRDHGLPSYNYWRKYCNLKHAANFDELWDVRHGVKDKLKSVYHSVDDIDLYVGGITEKLLYEGRVGPTFGCILGEQFSALKHGDNYWFERVRPDTYSSHFTHDQVEAIKHVSLAKIICENYDQKYIQEDVFRLPLHEYMAVCSDLPDLDLSPWGCGYD